jgi:DNA repair exonuclease SbcCD nuclease subunit
MKDHGIKAILQLGDLFDRRKYINFYTLKASKQYFFDPMKEMGVEFHTLLGNHDVYFKNTLEVNSTQLVLGEYDNVFIYDNPTTINFDGLDVDVIPWICDSNEKEAVEFISNSKSEFCAGHFELAGFEMDRGNICHEGWDAVKLSRYEVVFTGHFHHRSIKNNILYVGSPGEITWADYDDPRGFHVFDTETREIEFVQNPHTIFRKHIYNDEKFFYNDLKTFDFEQYKGKYVKVIIEKKTNTFLFDSFMDHINRAGPIDLSVVEDFTEINSVGDTADVDQADDTITIINKVVDGLEIDLNKSKLKDILRGVYTEAISIES